MFAAMRPTGLDLCQTHQPAGALTVINAACVREGHRFAHRHLSPG